MAVVTHVGFNMGLNLFEFLKVLLFSHESRTQVHEKVLEVVTMEVLLHANDVFEKLIGILGVQIRLFIVSVEELGAASSEFRL